jgi:hypothetical protein
MLQGCEPRAAPPNSYLDDEIPNQGLLPRVKLGDNRASLLEFRGPR